MIVRARYGDWTDLLSIVPALLGSQAATPPPPPPKDNTALYLGAGLSVLVLVGGFLMLRSRQGE